MFVGGVFLQNRHHKAIQAACVCVSVNHLSKYPSTVMLSMAGTETVWTMRAGGTEREQIKHRAGAVTAQTVMHCANVKIRIHIQRHECSHLPILSFYFDISFSLSTVWFLLFACFRNRRGKSNMCIAMHLKYSEQAYRFNNKHQCDWVSFSFFSRQFFLIISEWI